MRGAAESTYDNSSFVGLNFLLAGVLIVRKRRTSTRGLNVDSRGNADIRSNHKSSHEPRVQKKIFRRGH